jgi:hypothetical protein
MLESRLRCLTGLKPSQTKVNEPSVCSTNGLEVSAHEFHFKEYISLPASFQASMPDTVYGKAGRHVQSA